MNEEELKPQPMEQGKQTLVLAVVLSLLIGVVLGAFGVYIWTKITEPPIQIEAPIIQPDAITTKPDTTILDEAEVDGVEKQKIGSVINELDSEWNEYINYDLGFSINIPKQSYLGSSVDAFTAVKVFEDDGGVYIAGEKEIDLQTGQLKAVTLEGIKNRSTETWRVLIKNVASEDALASFLKQRFYSGCEIRDLKESTQKGLFDVLMATSGPDVPESEYCFINWITIIKYSPEKQKLAQWNIGQDASFFTENFEKTYDSDMAQSFRFLD